MNISLSCFPSLSSTSTYAQTLIREGHEPPFAIQADVQTRGVGQRGKSWTSPKGNLYLSIVIPNCTMELKARGLIPLKAANLVCRWLLRKFGISARIKWPNDLYFAGKKLAGILCQTSFNSTTWGDLFVGIGINIAQAPVILGAPYQSISLSQIKDQSFEVKSLAQSLVDFWGREWFAASEEVVRSQYEHFSSIPFSFWKEKQEGKAVYYRELGIDEIGSLCLQELGGASVRHAREKKIASANHGLSKVFLGPDSSPFLLAFQWQHSLYLAVFADRTQISPSIAIDLSLMGIDAGLDSVLQTLRKYRQCRQGMSWPVACCGSTFLNDRAMVKRFEAQGFELIELSAKPRLSSGFDSLIGSWGKIRLAAAESCLERKRSDNQVYTNGVILDWTRDLGFADHIDREGRLIGTLNAHELAKFVSDMEQKQSVAYEHVSEDKIFDYILHGLMLVAIG